MVKKVFTVYDEKSEAYLQPFFLDTIGQAKRAITDCVNDPNHNFGKHPSDYTLFYICNFDDTSGKFLNEVHQSLGNLVEFKIQSEIDLKQTSMEV
jgi:hypothetical protein